MCGDENDFRSIIIVVTENPEMIKLTRNPTIEDNEGRIVKLEEGYKKAEPQTQSFNSSEDSDVAYVVDVDDIGKVNALEKMKFPDFWRLSVTN